MPTPSSSLASRTSVISGSSSAIRIRCTSHVSGSADIKRTPHAFSASYTTRELSVETGTSEVAYHHRKLTSGAIVNQRSRLYGGFARNSRGVTPTHQCCLWSRNTAAPASKYPPHPVRESSTIKL